MRRFTTILKTLWHSLGIVVDAAMVLHDSGMLKFSPQMTTAFLVAAAVEHAAGAKAAALAPTSLPAELTSPK